MKNKTITALLCMFLFINAYTARAQKISYENGIKIIENSSGGIWGNNPKIKLIYEGKFGNHNEKDKNTMFTNPSDIAFDKEGNMYVLDGGDCVIKKFDVNKKFLYSFGRKGKGPGEMTFPNNLAVDSKGNIYAFDFGNFRINIYSPEGKSTGTIATKYSNYDFTILNDGRFIIRNPYLDGGSGLKEGNVPLFQITNQKGDKLKEFGQGVYFTNKIYKLGGNRLNFCVDENQNTYAAFLFQNRIDKYDKNGNAVFKIKRKPPVDRRLPEGKDMYKTLNSGIAVDSKERIWLAATRRMEKPEEIINTQMTTSPGSGISIEKSGKGLSVVKTDMYEIELYDKEGQLLCKFPINHFTEKIRLFRNKLYIIENERELTIHIYRISDL